MFIAHLQTLSLTCRTCKPCRSPSTYSLPKYHEVGIYTIIIKIKKYDSQKRNPCFFFKFNNDVIISRGRYH